MPLLSRALAVGFTLRMCVASAVLVGTLTPAAPIRVAAAQVSSVSDPDPQTAARVLTSRILDGDDPDSAAAVSEAFAWAGVATSAPDGITRAPVGPTIPVQVLEDETGALADSVRARAQGNDGISLTELGDVLQQMGWNLPAGVVPGDVLAQVLDEWVNEARSTPQSPHSFVPLFLQAMQEHIAQQPGGFTFTTAGPDQVQLSPVEVQLLLLAYLRGTDSYTEADVTAGSDPAQDKGAGSPEPGTPSTGGDSGLFLVEAQYAQADDQGPCTRGFNNLGWFKNVELDALQRVTNSPFQKAFAVVAKKIGIDIPQWQSAAILKMATVARLFSLMNSIKLEALSTIGGEYADQQVAHYNHDGGTTNRVTFSAIITVPAPDPDPRVRDLYDCAHSLGLSVPEDLNDWMSSAHMDWRLDGLGGNVPLSASPQGHAKPVDGSFEGVDEGVPYMLLTSTGTPNVYVAELDTIMNNTKETEVVHEYGELHRDKMWVEAQLSVREFNFEPLLDAALAGAIAGGVFGNAPGAASGFLVGPLVQLGKSFYKGAFGPRVRSVVNVSWHEAPDQTVTIVPGTPGQPCRPAGFAPDPTSPTGVKAVCATPSSPHP